MQTSFLAVSGCAKFICIEGKIRGFSTYENRWGEIIETINIDGIDVPKPLVADSQRGAIVEYSDFLETTRLNIRYMLEDLDEKEAEESEVIK